MLPHLEGEANNEIPKMMMFTGGLLFQGVHFQVPQLVFKRREFWSAGWGASFALSVKACNLDLAPGMPVTHSDTTPARSKQVMDSDGDFNDLIGKIV